MKNIESKLAQSIADTLADSYRYDERGGTWRSKTKRGFFDSISEKKILKIIITELDARLPNGYSWATLNKIMQFVTIHLLLEKPSQTEEL
jgi:hypothetical protein